MCNNKVLFLVIPFVLYYILYLSFYNIEFILILFVILFIFFSILFYMSYLSKEIWIDKLLFQSLFMIIYFYIFSVFLFKITDIIIEQQLRSFINIYKLNNVLIGICQVLFIPLIFSFIFALYRWFSLR